MSWKGRVLAQIIVGFLFACVALLILINRKFVSFSFNKRLMIHALKFGGGLIPHTLGGLLIILTNRFFLLNMISAGETGLYSVASQIGSIISFFTISFNNAYVPWLYDKLKRNDYNLNIKIVKFTYIYFIVILLAGFIFYLFSPILFNFFIDSNFYNSSKYLLWVIFGFVFQGMYFMVTNYITYSEKTFYQAVVTFTIGVLNIPLNYFLIKIFGGIGAGVAFCICFFLLFIFTWIASNRVYKMPWRLKSFFASKISILPD